MKKAENVLNAQSYLEPITNLHCGTDRPRGRAGRRTPAGRRPRRASSSSPRGCSTSGGGVVWLLATVLVRYVQVLQKVGVQLQKLLQLKRKTRDR